MTAPTIQSGWFTGLSSRGPSDIWAYGSNASKDAGEQANAQPLLEHFNGTTWQTSSLPLATPGSMINGVDDISPKNVWAVGGLGEYPLLDHFNGTTWQADTSPPRFANFKSSLLGISSAAGTMFILVAVNPGNSRWVMRLDKKGWHYDYLPSIPMNTNDQNVESSILAVSPTDAWAAGVQIVAAGDKPLLEHWNGRVWKQVRAPLGSVALDQLVHGPNHEVWLVGRAGSGMSTVYQLSGAKRTKWIRLQSPGTSLDSVSVSMNKAWATTPTGGVVRYSNKKWTVVYAAPSSSRISLAAIDAISSSDVWAVGEENGLTLALRMSGNH